MNVRCVMTDGTVVTVEVDSLTALPNLVLVGKDERGIDTLVNFAFVVRAYSIEESPVLTATAGAV